MSIRSRRRFIFFLILIAAAFLSLQLSGIIVNDFDYAGQMQENYALPTSRNRPGGSGKEQDNRLSRNTQLGQNYQLSRNTQLDLKDKFARRLKNIRHVDDVGNRNREIILQNENTHTNHDRHQMDFGANGNNKLHLRNLASSKLQDIMVSPPVYSGVTNRTVKHTTASEKSNYEEEVHRLASNYQTVPPSVLQEENCPVCFGTSLCDEFYEGNIRWDQGSFLEVNQNVRSYNGTWIDDSLGKVLAVTIKQFSNHRMLDNYICQMTSAISTDNLTPDQKMKKQCDVSSRILKMKLANKNATQQDYVRREIGKLQYRQNTLFSLPRCASQRLLDKLQTGNHLSDFAMLSTALVLNPQTLTAKFIHNQIPQLSHYFPSYYGECGHTIIQEHESYKPLRKFLPEDWLIRVNLALQVLQMVEDFRTASPDWMVVFGNITYDNLAVTKEGAIKVIDSRDVMIVDKSEINQTLLNTTPSSKPTKPCNEECLFNYATDLAKDPNTQCRHAKFYSQVMYMLVCQRFLSDLESTKVIRYFDAKNKDFADHPGGLLRNPPYELDLRLTELMYECVFESRPGQRKIVFNTLKKMVNVINRSKIGSAYW